jgi:hypothetical protein
MNLNKSEAKKMIDCLPENATWNDLMCQIYVKMLNPLFRSGNDFKAKDSPL